MTVTLNDISVAHQRILPFIHNTPVQTSRMLNRRLGGELYFKCENFQKGGAFKARGAFNAIHSLDEQTALRGIVTHSSGNHAAAVALAAASRGTSAHVVMPDNASAVKKAAVSGYGAHIIECAPNLIARETTTQQVIKETGATFIHPFDDARVISGQGTAAMEMIKQVGELDMVICPVGGGGLLSGTAIACRGLTPKTNIIAAEPLGADDAKRSFDSGKLIEQTNPTTIADGLLTSLGVLNFAIIQQHVDDILTTSESTIIEAMRLIWQHMKIIVEPSAAVPLAMLLEHSLDLSGKRIGIILSGGNIDIDHLPW